MEPGSAQCRIPGIRYSKRSLTWPMRSRTCRTPSSMVHLQGTYSPQVQVVAGSIPRLGAHGVAALPQSARVEAQAGEARAAAEREVLRTATAPEAGSERCMSRCRCSMSSWPTCSTSCQPTSRMGGSPGMCTPRAKARTVMVEPAASVLSATVEVQMEEAWGVGPWEALRM
eukprot:1923632-Prymnesium_polylepis.2